MAMADLCQTLFIADQAGLCNDMPAQCKQEIKLLDIIIVQEKHRCFGISINTS
jgi:hypothetical protein